MEEALKRLIDVVDEAKKMHDFMADNGYGDTPYTRIYGNALDAIYFMIGEDKVRYDTFDQSVTYQVMNSDMDDSEKIRILLSTYKQSA